MLRDLFSIVGALFGVLLVAVFLSLWVFPFLVGLLIALNVLRYREWLAMLAVAGSLVALEENGNFLYNLTYMPVSRFGPALLFLFALSFVAPPLLLTLVFLRSRRRLLWGLATLVLVPLALVSMRSEFVARRERDVEAYRQGVRPLSPETGVHFVRWDRDHRGLTPTLTERILLQGHIPERTRIVLLSDPFSRSFEPQFCTGVAATYWPPVKDPAELGNVTLVADLQGCDESWQSGVAVLEREVKDYRAVPAERFAGTPDAQVRNHPVVRQAFERFDYDPDNFQWPQSISRAVGPRQLTLFFTALDPIETPLNAFPCTEPALLIGVRDPGNIKAVLPYCAVVWNVFQLDDELYLAAVTQRPTPPGFEVMYPDQTNWFFQVEEMELKQLWPSP